MSAFGLQVFDMPPNWQYYPNHNNAGEPADDGQEEVYTVLSGSAKLLAGGQEWELRPGVFERVGAAERRGRS